MFSAVSLCPSLPPVLSCATLPFVVRCVHAVCKVANAKLISGHHPAAGKKEDKVDIEMDTAPPSAAEGSS